MVCCLCRRCINLTVFIHRLDRLIFHSKMCRLCNWSMITHQNSKARIFMEAVWLLVISDFQLFIYEQEKVPSRGEWDEALYELKGFYYAVVCMHWGGGAGRGVTGFSVSRVSCLWSDLACSTTGRVHYWEQWASCSEVTLFWALTTDIMHFCPPRPNSFSLPPCQSFPLFLQPSPL